jgi:hypothetical protein
MLLESSILPLAGGGFNAEGSPLEPAVRRRYRMGIQSGGVMTNKVWMVGMMLIVFVIGMMFSQNTSAQQGEIGRYQLEHDPRTDYSGVWKIDTVTGQLWECWHGNDGRACIRMEDLD